ncbi:MULTISPECIES: monovalent cation:proton antiporter-2 (CPA2) family protein [unclassified Acinetobacter]|uniref:monovalent cation:proton antiporter-2 (CPA2) family protein n=1 Tax=unclassified Acinetobacter TaxID=196816 RepID=UPI0029351942|nr:MULTISPECIES: monovalent cation:proton antiporter-2 (CPA2) family protein [unclassified Acinetobacter]WOE31191.1 monovalent cation:proton antiporter-2 (CPA2) family protein [Acinetobacter sp. SAAs470]WOE39387.1 monovalent cation:proton antiporter-2 (CPA2) family protein [Acinetobacter sp. SAAs474]
MPLLLQVTIFLGAALLLVPLLKRLGIATVLGYLFTGILLGPSVFNLANNPAAIQEISELGVILLMFLIGLELRPQRLWAMRKSIFLMGSVQVISTGLLLSILIFFAFQQHWISSLVIGSALALSSTAFALQLLTEKQQLNSTYGQQSFSILLFQDMAAIPLIAILPLLAGNSSAPHGIAYFAAIIATFTGLFLFSRYLMRPFFRFVAQSGAHELITAVGLFIVLAVVGLMDLLGISTTLGAFLTGVLLADSEFRHELEASIAPFKGLLLGLFFMAVGMTTNITLLLELPWLIIGATLLLILIKMMVLLAIARYYQFSWRNSVLLGACLAQGGEFAFVIFNVAKSETILSQSLFEPLILIVTLSMVLTPLLYWLVTRLLDRFSPTQPIPDYDQIPEEDTHHPLIIAGFGRFGQIIARVAYLQHLHFTGIDNNLEKIDFVRNYGGKVYYGDATQPEILRAAGIEHAKLFILAIDDIEDCMNIARHIRLNYPDLKLLVRARDRHHVHLLRDLGVAYIWRETYLSSLGMAYQALCQLGISAEDAYKSIELFRDYDEKLLAEQQLVYTDEQQIYSSHRNALAELEHLFENDAQIREQPTGVNLKRHLPPHHIDVTRDSVN